MWTDNVASEWTGLLKRATDLETNKATTDAALAALAARVTSLEKPPVPIPPVPVALLLNRDLSTGDLSQYTNRDYGLGTNVGGNGSGAGRLVYHANVLGRRCVGLTATSTAAAGGIPAGSDGVYLWDPVQPWGYPGQEWWLRASFLFPSAANVTASLGEAPYQATTGEWNWFLELHKDLTSGPSPITFDVLTDYPVGPLPGNNPRLRMRLAYGNESSPTIVVKEAPALQLDKWYEFLLHVKLDPAAGILEWLLDGTLMYSNPNVPTCFARPAGPSLSNLTVANYRLHATWPTTIFIGPLCIAKTKADALWAF